MTEIESADETCLVTTPEIPALHQTRQILQKLLDSGYRQERLRLIVNRVPEAFGDKARGITGTALGIPLYAVIPEGYTELHEAYSQGRSCCAVRNRSGRVHAQAGRKTGGRGGDEIEAQGTFLFFG